MRTKNEQSRRSGSRWLRVAWLLGALVLGGVAVLLGALVESASSGHSAEPEAEKLREPTASGKYYPGDPDSLRATVRKHLSQAALPAELPLGDKELVALVVPHSAYRQSGAVAACAYRLLEGRRYESVVVIGPSHVFPFEGVAVSEADVWRTPLGDVAVDRAAVRALQATGVGVRVDARAMRAETSIEVNLPFLQVALGEFKLVPLLMRDFSQSMSTTLGTALAEWAQNRSVLLIASANLSQFMPYEHASEVDRETLAAIQTLNAEEFARTTARLRSRFVPSLTSLTCAEGPVKAVLVAASLLGADEAHVLSYANSADVSGGPKDEVFGYGAVAIYRESRSGERAEEEAQDQFSSAQQQRLLQMARRAIEEYVRTGRVVEIDETEAVLLAERAAFVTLRKDGELRGWSRSLGTTRQLVAAVRDQAIAAATQDPRFPAVELSELGELEIEIHVLSRLRRIERPSEINLLRHGVAVESAGKRDCFLPEVARDAGWSSETLLSRLCEDKMGLPPDAWRRGASVYVFTVQEFSSAS